MQGGTYYIICYKDFDGFVIKYLENNVGSFFLNIQDAQAQTATIKENLNTLLYPTSKTWFRSLKRDKSIKEFQRREINNIISTLFVKAVYL